MAAPVADVLLITADRDLRARVRGTVVAGGELRSARRLVPWRARITARTQLWIDLDDLHADDRTALREVPAARRIYFYNRATGSPGGLPAGIFVRKPCTSAALTVLWARVTQPGSARIAPAATRRTGGARRTPSSAVLPRLRVEQSAVDALPAWLLEFQELRWPTLRQKLAERLPALLGYRAAGIYLAGRAPGQLELAASSADDTFADSLEYPRRTNSGEPALTLRRAPADETTLVPLTDAARLVGAIQLKHPARQSAELSAPAAQFLARAISHAKQHARARREARIDRLTGLQNARGIRETASRDLHRAGRGLALLMLDLDRLKHVNDAYGHPTGDAVLRQAAERINSALRQMDCAGRHGGDEFLIVLPETGPGPAERVAQRVLSALKSQPAYVQGRRYRLSASIGVAASGPEVAIDDLIHRADQAMYAAKRAGGGRVISWSEGLSRLCATAGSLASAAELTRLYELETRELPSPETNFVPG